MRAGLLSSRILLKTFSAALMLSGGLAVAQVVVVPTTPVVGSSNPATAEPTVSRPTTKPCVVPLLSNQAFTNFDNKPLTYTPPAACPGPWAKVVLTADFTVTAGRQFDRTASFYLGNANIYYGTTAEPRKTLSPSWHVESDLTDLSALFKTPQTGQAVLGNVVDTTYTGIIYGSAALEFYPTTFFQQPPLTVADLVVPVSGTENAGTLNTTADQITQTVNLPRNTEKVFLDVIAQSQSGDEFWYLCVPSDQATPLESCGNTAFRETEVTIDGKAAGVAPVYPWIYTGGIDPYLWEPIVGVQTLNFKPYRVDLTPFAGVLGDGGQHTVGVSVFNANSYFLATANLLVYTDHGRPVVSGGLLNNTLGAAPVPQVVENLQVADGATTGTITVGSDRSFTASGYVNTSHGRVETTVSQRVNFLSKQTFNVSGTQEIQNGVQTSTVDSDTKTRDGFLVETVSRHVAYPLTFNYSYVLNADGSQTQVVSVDQQNQLIESRNLNGFTFLGRTIQEEVNSNDTLQITAAGAIAAPGIGSTTSSYTSRDTLGGCYSRSLAAANQVLTSVTDGAGCRR